MKVVNFPITVPEGDRCVSNDNNDICRYFDNEGGHPHCDLGFDGQSGDYSGDYKKSPDCAKLVENATDEKKNEDTYTKLIRLVRENQDDPISIRKLAKKLRMKQSEVLEECYDNDLNVNIGIISGNGYGVFDAIGDYNIEDLTYDIHKYSEDSK
jgi:hypothetical protein